MSNRKRPTREDRQRWGKKRPTSRVAEAIKKLSLDERVVVKCLSFPMLPKSQKETARVLGCHWQDVATVEREAMAKIGAHLREVLL